MWLTTQAGQLRMAIPTRSPLPMPRVDQAVRESVGNPVELGEGEPLVAGNHCLIVGVERAEGLEKCRKGRREVVDDRAACRRRDRSRGVRRAP